MSSGSSETRRGLSLLSGVSSKLFHLMKWPERSVNTPSAAYGRAMNHLSEMVPLGFNTQHSICGIPDISPIVSTVHAESEVRGLRGARAGTCQDRGYVHVANVLQIATRSLTLHSCPTIARPAGRRSAAPSGSHHGVYGGTLRKL